MGAFHTFAQAVCDVFAIAPVDPDLTAFSLNLEAWHLGTIMIGCFKASALHFERSAALVASSGLDHLLVQLYTGGGFAGDADGMPVAVAAGDVVVFDLSRPFATVATAFENVSLLVPRGLLRDRVSAPGLLHGTVLPAASPLTGLLASHVRALVGRAGMLSAEESTAAAGATAALIGTLLGAVLPARSDARGSASQLRTATALIDARIADPDLDGATLARQLGVSRATLYRLFAPTGGVAAFIRKRRLTGAAIEIADRTRGSCRLSEVARRWGFASEAAFHRAFRTAFGVSPSTARKHSLLADVASLAPADQPAEQQFAEWMRLLHA